MSEAASSSSSYAFLNLSSRSRVLTQVVVSMVIVAAALSAYWVVKPMLDGMEIFSSEPTKRLPELKTWVFFLLLIVGIIPGVFVFLTLKREFQANDRASAQVSF